MEVLQVLIRALKKMLFIGREIFNMDHNHNESITKITPFVTKWRRELHKNAEVGFCEYVTTHYIYENLKKLDFELFIGEEVL